MTERRAEMTVRTEIINALRVEFVEAPAPGSPVSGDIARVAAGNGGAVWFMVADMAGSGRKGHASWREIEPEVDAAWGRLIESSGAMEDLKLFGEAVNASAYAADVTMCMSAGSLTSAHMDWATWGYGVHVLPSSHGTAWELPLPGKAFGLKLGWVSPQDFAGNAGAFVGCSFSSPTRVVAFSDGLLANDHEDPAAIWAWLEGTAIQSASAAAETLVDTILDRAHIQADDVTLVTMNVEPG